MTPFVHNHVYNVVDNTNCIGFYLNLCKVNATHDCVAIFLHNFLQCIIEKYNISNNSKFVTSACD